MGNTLQGSHNELQTVECVLHVMCALLCLLLQVAKELIVKSVDAWLQSDDQDGQAQAAAAAADSSEVSFRLDNAIIVLIILLLKAETSVGMLGVCVDFFCSFPSFLGTVVCLCW